MARDEKTRKIQLYLIKTGYLKQPKKGRADDGIWGPLTDAAYKEASKSVMHKTIMDSLGSTNLSKKPTVATTISSTPTLTANRPKNAKGVRRMTAQEIASLPSGQITGTYQGTTSGGTHNRSYTDARLTTREGYVQSKLNERQREAARINVENPAPFFPTGGYMAGHDFDYYGHKGMNDAEILKLFTGYRDELQSYLDKNSNSMHPESLKQAQQILNYYNLVVAKPSTVKTNGIGFGCINNATSGFGAGNRFASNVDLYNRTKAGNTNYELLPWSGTKLQVGDIIQIGDGVHHRPHHAVQVTGFNLLGMPQITQVHADDASMDDKTINSAFDYLKVLVAGQYNNQGLSVIRYKGSPSERAAWNAEFNNQNR